MHTAAEVARSQGKSPAGMELMIAEAEPIMDWRSKLWRYIEPARNDFGDLDVRLLNYGLASEGLESEHLHAAVALDTSGSMYGDLGLLYAELKSIQATYPSIRLDMWFVDAAAYGPYELDGESELPGPTGGGGTSFIPFFEEVEELEIKPRLLIYFTDGYGTFPSEEPEDATMLWLVVPGGAQDDAFPFGEVIRMGV